MGPQVKPFDGLGDHYPGDRFGVLRPEREHASVVVDVGMDVEQTRTGTGADPGRFL